MIAWSRHALIAAAIALGLSARASATDRPPPNPLKNAYFGAAHVHTVGPQIKIVTPLDFYAVSDHAEFMGVFPKMADPTHPLSKTKLAKGVTSSDPNVAMQRFAQILRDMSERKVDPTLTGPKISRSVWAEIVQTADRYYRPGWP